MSRSATQGGIGQVDCVTPSVAEPGELRIVEGYRPGAIGRIAALHADYYSRYWRFGLYFEAKVARDCADFLSREGDRDRLWLIVRGPGHAGDILGSLAIDGSKANGEERLGRVAHLRWFIMADDVRGLGLGDALMRRAIAFCRQIGFDSVYLWTFAGLDAARHLYEKHGFGLAEAMYSRQWGLELPEQRFVLTLGSTED